MSETAQKTIIVVDDEPAVRTMLDRYLSKEGYDVKCAASGEALRGLLARMTADLVLLDLILPGEDGLQIATMLRNEYPATAIIMLTSKNEEVDRVIGLEMGADDYITKPFGLREVLARIRSVLRRSTQAAPMPKLIGKTYRFEGWTLDTTHQVLTNPEGDEVRLTSNELSLLKCFVEHAGKVMSRDRILDLTRGYGADPLDRVVDVQVKRLRTKIEADPADPTFIKTVRGAGYVFTGILE